MEYQIDDVSAKEMRMMLRILQEDRLSDAARSENWAICKLPDTDSLKKVA
jgi:hypothetical protein